MSPPTSVGVHERQLEAGHTIRVVARRTGLSMDALRAWERRYGFPAPKRRTGSNRRLYSDHDLQKLTAMVGAMEHGYRVGDLVHRSPEELASLVGSPAGVGPARPPGVDA